MAITDMVAALAVSGSAAAATTADTRPANESSLAHPRDLIAVDAALSEHRSTQRFVIADADDVEYFAVREQEPELEGRVLDCPVDDAQLRWLRGARLRDARLQ